MRQWESTINRLIKEAAQRRASERNMSKLVANSTNPAQNRMNGYGPGSILPPYSSQPLSNLNGRSRGDSLYKDDPIGNGYGSGPQGYPPHDGFDAEDNEDEFEDYPPTNGYASSGRGTPVGARRGTASMPPERETMPGYDRPRAQTEGVDGPALAQWRNNGRGGPGLGSNIRPITPRLNSNMSAMSAASYASDASFGNGVSSSRPPPLRSQFSSNKLRAGYQENGSGDFRNGLPPKPSHNSTPVPLNRSRSASQPSAYVPRTIPPPLPPALQWNSQSNSSLASTNKRGSGSSQSTGDSSDYSPNSSSPITPFGSSESSLGGVGLRTSRSQVFENAVNGAGNAPFPHPVKVKVHFHEDIFVIQVPRATVYEDLVGKVGRKIRLCGPRRDDGPLRVKYKDEDGDMVSLGSTEDVQMAFEQFRPGGQVILYVT